MARPHLPFFRGYGDWIVPNAAMSVFGLNWVANAESSYVGMTSWISTVCPELTFFVVAVATPLELLVPVPITVHALPALTDCSNVYGIPMINGEVPVGCGTA